MVCPFFIIMALYFMVKNNFLFNRSINYITLLNLTIHHRVKTVLGVAVRNR